MKEVIHSCREKNSHVISKSLHAQLNEHLTHRFDFLFAFHFFVFSLLCLFIFFSSHLFFSFHVFVFSSFFFSFHRSFSFHLFAFRFFNLSFLHCVIFKFSFSQQFRVDNNSTLAANSVSIRYDQKSAKDCLKRSSNRDQIISISYRHRNGLT